MNSKQYFNVLLNYLETNIGLIHQNVLQVFVWVSTVCVVGEMVSAPTGTACTTAMDVTVAVAG